MKEELFQLLDGDLPDDATAELLHLLSVDPDKRSIFRQQLKLQGALYRNEQHDGLTPGEEAEMLERLGSTIGLKQGSSPRGLRPGTIALIVLLLSFGTGLGILIANWTGANNRISTSPPSIQQVEQSVPAAPPVVSPPFNRDSVIAAISDSVDRAFHDSIASIRIPTQVPVKKKVRSTIAHKNSGSAVTGVPSKRHR
jgi:hypothetical protein